MESQKAIGFLKNAYYQGHGRYVNQIVRLTLKFCKTNGACRELRKFIETRLVDVARENEGCAIYVKPRLFKGPVVTSEYLNGEVHAIGLGRMSATQIEAWMKWYITRSGNKLNKLDGSVSTSKTSIQGIWHPFYFRDPSTNIKEFPNEELARHERKLPSATEQLIDIANEYGFQSSEDADQRDIRGNDQAHKIGQL